MKLSCNGNMYTCSAWWLCAYGSYLQFTHMGKHISLCFDGRTGWYKTLSVWGQIDSMLLCGWLLLLDLKSLWGAPGEKRLNANLFSFQWPHHLSAGLNRERASASHRLPLRFLTAAPGRFTCCAEPQQRRDRPSGSSRAFRFVYLLLLLLLQADAIGA